MTHLNLKWTIAKMDRIKEINDQLMPFFAIAKKYDVRPSEIVELIERNEEFFYPVSK